MSPRIRQSTVNQVVPYTRRLRVAHVCAALLLLTLFFIELVGFTPSMANAQQSHTASTVDATCAHVAFSSDGNPFPICPGPFPTAGGNCTWWAWEQWHLLGYDLPLNWGNAADWVVDAERSGLPIGMTPRLGAIVVFPRADGVWAYGPAGHVAFVSNVSADSSTFDVTYQNYGDPTPMYVGRGYNVSYINQSRFQNGSMRFIYFPREIDAQRFAKLPGSNGVSPLMIEQTNSDLAVTTRASGDRVALGLQPVSSDQEFNADFTGEGVSDLLLYNRQQGSLKVLKLYPSVPAKTTSTRQRPHSTSSEGEAAQQSTQTTTTSPQVVNLGDAAMPVNSWGAALDIHIGNFAGTGQSDILLYDRTTGVIQLLSLSKDLKIKRHMTLPGLGTDWELYVGLFEDQRSGIFMYNRFAAPQVTVTATPTPAAPHEIAHPASPTPTKTVKKNPTPTPSPTATPTLTNGTLLDFALPQDTANPPPGKKDLSGAQLAAWERAGRSANILLLDFNKDFSVHVRQQYTLWHANWEVYVGRFANAHRDGIFLYDRSVGEGRIMDFDTTMKVADYQELHNLDGNWEMYSGDFVGMGRAQLLLYDPSAGNAQLLTFAPNLALRTQKLYSNWGQNQVLYVGHFGMKSLSIMLYDPQAQQSSFLALDTSLAVARQFSVQSWGPRWQILVGAFLDRSRCRLAGNCSLGDDILALDRKTGQIQQFVFSFGRQFEVFDNRSQAFVRSGVAADAKLNSVDTTTFSLVGTLKTSIRNEELY